MRDQERFLISLGIKKENSKRLRISSLSRLSSSLFKLLVQASKIQEKIIEVGFVDAHRGWTLMLLIQNLWNQERKFKKVKNFKLV